MATSTAAGQSTASSRGLRAVMRQHPLSAFFVMAYAFSWILTLPFILSEWGILPGNWTFAFVIKAFAGPFLAGFIMVNILEGKEGLRNFRHRFIQFRAGVQWYLFILLAIPALFILGLIVQPGVMASFTGVTPRFAVSYLINFVIIFFFGGPLAEEPGWRGFALPRMQTRFGALKGALLLGVVWTFWHLPDFFTSAQGGGPGTGWTPFIVNLPIFLVMVTAISVMMAWVYNHTQGSLFIAILLHASINACQTIPEIFPVKTIPMFTLIDIAMLIGVAVSAVLVIIFSRGKLGYQASQA